MMYELIVRNMLRKLGIGKHYIKSYNILEEIFHVDKLICPFSKDMCNIYVDIVDSFRNIQ